MEDLEKFQKYRQLGLKLTPQRLAILNYLEGNNTHPSADDIYQHVSKRFPSMSFATVYNTLEALRQRNKILELAIDPSKKRFDPNTDPHHHIICIHCQKIVDVQQNYAVDVPRSERHGFELLGNHITFFGICPECYE